MLNVGKYILKRMWLISHFEIAPPPQELVTTAFLLTEGFYL